MYTYTRTKYEQKLHRHFIASACFVWYNKSIEVRQMQYGLFEYYNPNPIKANHGDCVVRALCKALDRTWEDVYVALCVQGLALYDLPNADVVWGAYLRSQGFRRYIIPNTCPDCYTIADFSQDHPEGTFILGTGRHAVTVQDGVIYDNWRSDNEIPIFYFTKEVI